MGSRAKRLSTFRSNSQKTPIPMPNGKFAIVGIIGDIAKEDGKGGYASASLSEVYDHHWVVEDFRHRNFLCPYGPNYVFGIGSESRKTPVNFPNVTTIQQAPREQSVLQKQTVLSNAVVTIVTTDLVL